MDRQEFDIFRTTCAENKWGGNQKEVYSWWAQQHDEELWELLSILQDRSIKIVLEVGSSHGGLLAFLAKILPEDGLIIGIEMLENIAFSLQKNMSSTKFKNSFLLEKDSHREETLDTVKRILEGKKLDFLFIDGDHSYYGCKKDYEMYSPLVKKGGIVGFHDVAIDQEVRKVFDEIDKNKVVLPIHYMGIGLIYL